jgi:acyl-CoA synthetase (AMP-forming)/AMP-acid ligase II
LGPGEAGELVIKGPAVFKEYWHRPDETAQAFTPDGWYRSGDFARIDDRGYVYLLDRRSDMIVSGGINIYPSDIERALMRHPAVAEAVVFGVPSAKWGESITAAVRLRPGSTVSVYDIEDSLRKILPRHEIPKSIELVNEELPKNASGKVLRREVREPYWRGNVRRVN